MNTNLSLAALVEAARDLDGFCCFDLGTAQTIVTWGRHPPHTQIDGWQAYVRAHTAASTPSTAFSGGVVGWLGYEAGASVEAMPEPSRSRATHDVCLWRVDGAITLHHETGELTTAGSEDFRREAECLIRRATAVAPRAPVGLASAPWMPQNVPDRSAMFTDGVGEVLDHVRKGDVYQVSLAWEETDIPVRDAALAWLHVRSTNPATRGCFVRQGPVEIVSNSPELFLEIDPTTRNVRSCPIKGTASRSTGPAGLSQLKDNPKERAELTMIVDLVRNDLGKVAAPGSVRANRRTVRTCGDLWHAEQAVEATLAPSFDAVDAIAAAFPPGSVTGAPKVRAMEVIHRLEGGPRGVYTGALGFFGDGGRAHFNVAIRTATVLNGRARFHVGAGIVADSQPELEWRETLAKARALAQCLASTEVC